MTRLLLLLAVVVGVILWWKHSQRGRRREAEAPPPPTPAAPAESMLRCVECGIHLPASQTLPGRGGVFCSAEHRKAFEDRDGTGS